MLTVPSVNSGQPFYYEDDHEGTMTRCERFNLSPETWTRQEHAFGLLKKVYAKRGKIRGEKPLNGA